MVTDLGGVGGGGGPMGCGGFLFVMIVIALLLGVFVLVGYWGLKDVF